MLDSHVHFWDPRNLSYPWLSEVPVLNRPFTPEILLGEYSAPIQAIFVEAGAATHHAGAEIEGVRQAARRHPWIRGAVAHVPLEDTLRAQAAIRWHGADPFVVGVRRNLQDEAPGFIADAALRRGVIALGEADLPFDVCVREHQIPEVVELADACPQTTIILDHLGKPRSPRPADATTWRASLRRLAKRDNVVCKLSGLATELPVGSGRAVSLSVLREALDCFGPARCLYGSDWPVMSLTTDYQAWLDLVREALSHYPAPDAHAVLYANAARVYRVEPALPCPAPTEGKPA